MIKFVDSGKSQHLYEIVRQGEEIGFLHKGIFSYSPRSSFGHRELFDHSLKGYGLGTKALKTSLALSRQEGFVFHLDDSGRKSVLLMFLRNGFKIDFSSPELGKRGIKNEKGLVAFLKRKDTPEELGFTVFLRKKIGPLRKKQ